MRHNLLNSLIYLIVFAIKIAFSQNYIIPLNGTVVALVKGNENKICIATDNKLYVVDNNTIIWERERVNQQGVQNLLIRDTNYIYWIIEDNSILRMNVNDISDTLLFVLSNKIKGIVGLNNNYIYALNRGSMDTLYAINKTNMTIEWSFTYLGYLVPPVVTNRNISIGGSNGHLYYLDDSGNVLWTVSPGCYVHGQVFFDNLIGFTNSCGNYFIYDLNGNQILQTNLGYGWINIPVIEGSFAYIPDGNGFVIKLNKNTGHIEWANLVGNGSNIPMIIGKNFVYLSSLDEQIYQINKETGGIALSFNAFSDVPHSPYFMLDKGKLYVGGNQKLFVFSVNDTISDCEWPTLYHDNWRTSNPQFPVLTGIKNNYVNKAQKYHLYQNYPNPFNPTTTISYDLPKAGQVKLTIYNMLGQKIKSLINHRQLPGQYSVTWDGKDDLGNEVPSGIYLYQLQVGNSIQAKKMILTR